MKHLLCCVLLLCLGLAGCDLSPVVEAPMEAPSLPVPEAPDSAAEWDFPSQTLSGPEAAVPSDIWETVPPPGPSADVELVPDVVTVHQEAIPMRIENAARWEGFLAAAELGDENSLTLRLVYPEGAFDLVLSYDGEVYTLRDGGYVTTCKYLIVEEDDNPPARANWQHAVHYLLSDDPELTWQQYMARMFSSAMPPPNQPAARGLFSVYE